MLKMPLIHPGVLEALGRLGHGSQVLISDGNFPHATATPLAATRIFLNYAPGMLSVTDVLGPLVEAIPIEAATVMEPNRSGPYAMEGDPPIFHDFAGLLEPAGVETLRRLERFAFYDAARGVDVGLVLATAEQRIYANLLLTIGVVKPA
mgnify:CR=1 FL=1